MEIFDMKTMKDLFSVGDTISNYCNGFFGRDDYEEKLCIMVTEKYAIFQYIGDSDLKGFATVLNWDDKLPDYRFGGNWSYESEV